MVSPIPPIIKKIWEKWNIRGFVLLSLSVQIILTLGARFRERTPNMWVTLVIWSAYFLADWAAYFAIGLITSSQVIDNSFIPSPNNNGGFNSDLLAFWAPFLLLHLGGPDTITAFSLEDNALWLRHLLGLVFHVIATVYVFIQSLPKNKLWLPTVLLFLAGIIKYAERTRALYLASLDNFKESMLRKPDPGFNYERFMETYSSQKAATIPIHLALEAKKSWTSNYVGNKEEMENNIALVRHAFHFFNIFKCLIVDLISSIHERFESRAFFGERTAEEAFKLVAIELNFMYEALFTKMVVVHSKRGCLFRAISFGAVCTALVCFQKIEKHDFHGFDVGITYTLLFGAIGLDLIAVFMLVFSDWTVAAMKKSCQKSCTAAILRNYLTLKQSMWYSTKNPNSCLERCRQLLFRRWYESVSTFNLIHFSLMERPKVSPKFYDYPFIAYIEIIYLLGLKDLRDKIKYRSSKQLSRELWAFIFTQLKSKSTLAVDSETARRIFSARGDWILQDSDWNEIKDCRKLLSYVVDVEYDQSILLWHIATELCYNLDNDPKFEGDPRCIGVGDKMEYCKTLSDYMVYLLVMQPVMMSSVAGIGQGFRDTCEEAKRFFNKGEIIGQSQREVCERILEVNTEVKPALVKGNRCKSVLFDACILAKELMTMNEKKWELMSEVWVELLLYAAGHCRANDHAQLLSKGGELVTFVWLVMAHFGIGEQIQIGEKFEEINEQVHVKLIVAK